MSARHAATEEATGVTPKRARGVRPILELLAIRSGLGGSRAGLRGCGKGSGKRHKWRAAMRQTKLLRNAGARKEAPTCWRWLLQFMVFVVGRGRQYKPGFHIQANKTSRPDTEQKSPRRSTNPSNTVRAKTEPAMLVRACGLPSSRPTTSEVPSLGRTRCPRHRMRDLGTTQLTRLRVGQPQKLRKLMRKPHVRN